MEISSDVGKAEALSSFFASVFTSEDNDIPTPTERMYNSTLTVVVITVEEV